MVRASLAIVRAHSYALRGARMTAKRQPATTPSVAGRTTAMSRVGSQCLPWRKPKWVRRTGARLCVPQTILRLRKCERAVK